jgi:carbonic anhydrase
MSSHAAIRRYVLGLVLLSAGCGAGTPPAEAPPAASSAPAASAPASAPSASAGASAVAAAPPAEPPPHVAWGYAGEGGPDQWGDLEPGFSLCKTGKSQTPIDLSSKAAKGPALKGLVFQYPPIPLTIFNNGHTVQVPSTGVGELTEGANKWNLLQFHFHAPSEHTVDGKRFDAELHFVHSNAKGELAVVGVFLRKGKENKALKAVFDNAPSDVGTDAKPVAGAKVDLKAILPSQTGYFTYGGSLTVPPCSEGVVWYVLKTPVEVSEAQIAKFHDVIHGDTNRPMQPIGDRTVLQF